MRRHLLAVFVACVSIAGATERGFERRSTLTSTHPHIRQPTRLERLLPRRPSRRNLGQLVRERRDWCHSRRFMELFAERRRGRRHAWLQLAAGPHDLRYRGRSRQPRHGGKRRLLRAVRLRRFNQHGYRLLFDAARAARCAHERVDALCHGWLPWRRHDCLHSRSLRCLLHDADGERGNSSFRNGWTIGGGLEATIEGAWTAKVEYLYFDLGSVNVDDAADPAAAPRQHLEHRDGRQPRARRHQLPVQQLEVGAIVFVERGGGGACSMAA